MYFFVIQRPLFQVEGFFLPLDRIKELKKLNHSIFINFLELLDILIKSPSSSKVYIEINNTK